MPDKPWVPERGEVVQWGKGQGYSALDDLDALPELYERAPSVLSGIVQRVRWGGVIEPTLEVQLCESELAVLGPPLPQEKKSRRGMLPDMRFDLAEVPLRVIRPHPDFAGQRLSADPRTRPPRRHHRGGRGRKKSEQGG